MTKYIANYSGGKDSTAMILELIRHNRPIDAVVMFDFGMEYPETYREVELMKKLLAEHDIPFIMAKPEHSFEWYCAEKPIEHTKKDTNPDGTKRHTKGYKFPDVMRRWCTRIKISTINKALKEHGINPKEVVDYVGIAVDEPKRIHADEDKIYPLAEYGITEKQALEISRKAGFFKSPHPYDHIDRVSCFCCPLAVLKTVKYLVQERPELLQKIKDIEEHIKRNTLPSENQDDWMWRRLEHHPVSYYEERFKKDTQQMNLFDDEESNKESEITNE